MKLSINGKEVEVNVSEDTPLLWVLRDELELTGTKYGCGMAFCGACTIYLNGEPMRSCVLPVSAAVGQKITTIEGLKNPAAEAIQKAWVEFGVPQCGYCQTGQVMAASALLTKNKRPSDIDIETAMSGHLCRCGTYQRIRSAIRKAAQDLA